MTLFDFLGPPIELSCSNSVRSVGIVPCYKIVLINPSRIWFFFCLEVLISTPVLFSVQRCRPQSVISDRLNLPHSARIVHDTYDAISPAVGAVRAAVHAQ